MVLKEKTVTFFLLTFPAIRVLGVMPLFYLWDGNMGAMASLEVDFFT